jgi:hypothetical protein
LPGAGKRGVGELLLNGYRVPLWDNENFLEMDGVDVCASVWMHWLPLNGSSRNYQNAKFMLIYILLQSEFWEVDCKIYGNVKNVENWGREVKWGNQDSKVLM